MFDTVCGIKTRANNAHDRNIVLSVVRHNRYRLPAEFTTNDVILDIGAHLGSFASACLTRGAGKVHVFEPDEENFKICVENLHTFGERAVLYQAAVWRSDRFDSEVLYTGAAKTSDGLNFGGGNVVFEDGRRISVRCEPLDSILSNIRRVRLIKLDCESSEWPILFSSRLLECVDELVGEYHEIGGKYNRASIPRKAQVIGFDSYTAEDLVAFLRRHDFSVEITARRDSNIGNFFAKKNMRS